MILFLFPLQWIMNAPVARGGEAVGGNLMAVTLILIPMLLLVTVSLCAVTSEGGLDWVGWQRGAIYTLVVTVGLTLVLLTWFSAALRGEDASQMPWAVRPFVPWAAYVIPPAVFLFSFLTLNHQIGAVLPTWVVRGPFLAAGAVSLLVGAGLVLELLSSSQQHAAAQVQGEVNRQTERDGRILAEVEAADPRRDFATLLPQTSKFEEPQIRALALKKVLSNPEFTAEMTTNLRNYCYSYALIFLDANDAPDPQALAEPVRDAFVLAAAHVRSLIKSEPVLYPDSFDYETNHIMSVATKFRSYGVDYIPAIREFRAAMDEPRAQGVNFQARRTLDQWLKSK